MTQYAKASPFGGLAGDIVGPASATDHAIARWDGTTGKLLQDSAGILDDAGVLTGLTGLTTSGTISLDGAVTINDAGADVDFRVEGDTDANLLFVDASTDRVGIGTNTPSLLLDVAGATNLDGAVTINESGADVDFRVEGDTEVNLLFVDASTDRVGIKTATPSTDFNVVGGTSLDGAVTINEAGADVDFRVEGDTEVNLLFVDASTDRVGIGTATPSSELHVVGDLTLSNLTASRALTTDGSSVIAVSATTATELGYVSGVTSAIQTQIDGKLGDGITANGAQLQLHTVEEELTGLSGASATTTIAFPSQSVIIGASVRVTTTITGATSYDVGDGATVNRFGGTLGLSAGSTNQGMIGPAGNYASTTVTLTANGSNFTGGAVRVAIHYLVNQPPTS